MSALRKKLKDAEASAKSWIKNNLVTNIEAYQVGGKVGKVASYVYGAYNIVKGGKAIYDAGKSIYNLIKNAENVKLIILNLFSSLNFSLDGTMSLVDDVSISIPKVNATELAKQEKLSINHLMEARKGLKRLTRIMNMFQGI